MKRKAIVLVILILALAIRIVYLNISPHKTLQSDELGYNQSAINIIENGIISYASDQPNSFITPGYPIFLAGLYLLFGKNFLLVQYVQAILSTATVLLIFLLSYKISNYKSALVAMVIAALYPPFIWANKLILTEVLFTFVLTLFFYLLKLSFIKKKTSHFLYSGLCLGIACIIRPSAALYLLLLLTLIFIFRKDFKFIKTSVVLIIGFTLIMSPWWIRNYNLYHRFVPFSSESGNTFLWGVHPWDKGAVEAITSVPKVKDEFKQNELYFNKAKEIMSIKFKENPLKYIRWLTIEKFIRFWNVYYPRDEIFSRTILLYHLIIVLLGFVYILKETLKKHNLELTFFIFYFVLVHMVFQPLNRYAFPLMPLIIVFASIYIMKMGFLKKQEPNIS